MEDLEELKIVSKILEAYRETQGYKKNRDNMNWHDDWRVFLQKRVKKTRGHLSKGEMLFWGAFFTDPKHSYASVKDWFEFIKMHGTFIQKLNAAESYDLILQYKKGWKMSIENSFPIELNTEDAHKYLAKAKEVGLIGDNYKWLKGMQLLACFCHDMSKQLNLGKGDRISWKPFEALFGIEKGKLRRNYNDIQKTGQNPSDIALVDDVFN